MGKGAKVAIGCGIAAVLVVVIGVAGVVGFGFWAKKKAEQALGGVSLADFQAREARIQELESRAESNSYTRPADGIIREDRLVRFLAVRKRIYEVYEKHKAEFEALSKKEDAGFGDGLKAFGWLNEVRLAHAEGIAEQEMNPDEYRFMVETIYQTFFASEIARSAGTETAAEAVEKAQEEGRAALEQAREEAREQGVDLGESWEEASRGIAELGTGMAPVDVPRENIALFRKYESEIKRYSMSGLEFAGF